MGLYQIIKTNLILEFADRASWLQDGSHLSKHFLMSSGF